MFLPFPLAFFLIIPQTTTAEEKPVRVIVSIDVDFSSEWNNDIFSAVKTYAHIASKKHLQGRGLSIIFVDDQNLISEKDENELSIIFTIAPCKNTWVLHQQLKKDNILHLAVTESGCPRLPTNEALTITLMNNEDQISQLILDLRSENVLHWKNAVIIYDDSISSHLANRIVKALSEIIYNGRTLPSISTGVFKLDEEENTMDTQITQYLSLFRTSRKHVNFLGFLKSGNMEKILGKAQQMGLLDIQNQWLIYVTDLEKNITSYASLINEGGNVAFLYSTPLLHEEESRDSMDLTWAKGNDGDMEDNSKLMQEVTHLMSSLAKGLKELNDAETELFNRVSEEEWEALKPTPLEQRNALLTHLKAEASGHVVHGAGVESWTEAPRVLEVATWSRGAGLVSWEPLFLHQHHGFRGRHIRVATFHYPPWSSLYLDDSGTILARRGLAFEILDELARNLNFSYSLVPGDAEDAVDAVRRRKATLGAAAFVASEHLEAAVSATTPVATEHHAFLTSRPTPRSRALIFMAPFDAHTWLCIAVSVLLMGPTLYVVHNLTPYYDARARGTAFGKVWKCLWYVYGALLQQGGVQVPVADSGRILVGTWWLVVIVVVTTYCGNLVAFLTFPSVASALSTIDELQAAMRDGSAATLGLLDAADADAMKAAPDARLRQLQSAAELHHGAAASREQLEERVRRRGHVLIGRTSQLLLLAAEQCDFRLGGETFLSENLVMIVEKNSPYLVLINEEIKKMHRGGLIQKWTSDSLPKKGMCKDKFHERGRSNEDSPSDGSTNREVTLDDMQGSFFVLFIGCFLAFLTISLEYIWNQRDIKVLNKLLRK